jgi:hypothetical protein
MACTACLVCLVSTVSGCCKNPFEECMHVLVIFHFYGNAVITAKVLIKSKLIPKKSF